MNLKLYNTMTRSLKSFVPVKPARAGLYACGPTVYDLAHIGHARASAAFDILVRYLRYCGLDVRYVRNFTDVDDKIIKRAQDLNKPWLELAEDNIRSFNEDMAALGCLPPTDTPRATEYIGQMLEDIEELVRRGRAYDISGDVYFDVGSFPEYGRLSGRQLSDQEAGARVTVDSRKKNPADFALWKTSRPGEPAWPSPWGPGRPGWHTECSAMSFRLLGSRFDIHGGGQDLIFPHHENELAQAEALGRSLAEIWVHNGFVNINNEKMSKSLGNVFNIKDVLNLYPAEAVRYFLVTRHYRSPLDFSEEALKESWKALERIYRTLALVPPVPENGENGRAAEPPEIRRSRERFEQAMDDDLNTAQAMGVIFEMVHELNRTVQAGDQKASGILRRALMQLGQVLNLWQGDPQAFLEAKKVSARISAGEVEELIRSRTEARQRKDWAEADRLRQELASLGVVVEDGAGRTSWHYA
ncbi:MAG: cysteine--tRNA ligase [Deltaproteobacteria bacterium]|jgi:cysteinyl-tRNA synthetase|nr:cysteine--tRNA ligase [Deltaproteobacteria bacterium]